MPQPIKCTKCRKLYYPHSIECPGCKLKDEPLEVPQELLNPSLKKLSTSLNNQNEATMNVLKS